MVDKNAEGEALVWLEMALADMAFVFADSKILLSDTDIELVDTDIELADTDIELDDTDIELADTDIELADTDIELPDIGIELLEEDVLSNTEFEVEDIVKIINPDLAQSSDAGKEWYNVYSNTYLVLISQLNHNNSENSKTYSENYETANQQYYLW